MAGITVSGVGSGLDINGLVSKLVSAESDPATQRLDSREASLQADLSAIGTFKGALSDFESAVSTLTKPTTFQGMKATVGDDNLLTASADSTADAGNYTIKVTQLAQASTYASHDTFTLDHVFDSGALTISVGGKDIPIQIDASHNTLTGIRDAINNTANVGVKASVIGDGQGYRLVLTATATGAANGITSVSGLSDTENGTKNLRSFDEGQPAQDARLEINGIPVTSASNTLDKAVSGVTLTLKPAALNNTTQLTVARDTATTTSAVQKFADAYNKLAGLLSSLTAYNPQTQQKGALLGDAQVNSVSSQLRRLLGGTVPGSSAYHSLSSIGISVQRDGTLQLNSSKLQTALADDPQDVTTLFAGSDGTSVVATTPGLAKNLDSFLTNLIKYNGTLDNRTASINKLIAGVTNDRNTLNQRIADLETRYRAQFNAMDKLVSQLTATGNFLTQQLAGLSSSNTK